MIPSHEPAGKIVKVGSSVEGSWKVGDRVGVLNFKKACGECTGCRQEWRKGNREDPRFCQKREMAGFKHDGAFAQFMLADPKTTVHLPDKVSYVQGAPLMCAGVCYFIFASPSVTYCYSGHGLGCSTKATTERESRRDSWNCGYRRRWASCCPVLESHGLQDCSH